MMKIIAFAALVLAAMLMVTVSAEEWTVFCQERGSCPDIGIDITVTNNNVCIAGGDAATRWQNRTMGLWCGETPHDLLRLESSTVAGMPVALASVDTGLFSAGMGFLNMSSGLWWSHDFKNVNGSSTFWSVGQDIKIVSDANIPHPTAQNAKVMFTGSFDMNSGPEGLLLSSNGGKDYEPIFVDDAMINLRYGWFSQNNARSNWLVTAGSWDEAQTTRQEQLDLANRCLRRSRHVCEPAPAGVSPQHIAKYNKRIYNPYNQAVRSLLQPSLTSGDYGSIWRSTDFGKTWQRIFESTEYYFNDISCSDVNEKFCSVVAERTGEAVVFVTEDGGANWKKTLTLESALLASLFRTKVISAPAGGIEYWATGGLFVEAEGKLQGVIYRSVDHGETWTLATTIDDVGILTGLAFNKDGTIGYALGSTQSNQTYMLRFNRN